MSVSLPGYVTRRLLRASSRTRVFEVERKRDGHRVIAKVFELDEGVEARAELEFRLLAELDVEGVVEVLGLERSGRELVLLLAHVPGCNLAEYAGQRPLALDDFMVKATRLSRILAEVHARRIIHRDIKPTNILVEAETGAVFLADFGVSVLLDDVRRHVYDPEVLTGTLPYLSPEQTGRTRREVDSRSDLYSLGVTFFELLTGRLPFVATAPLELIHAHLAREPPAPIALRPDLPPALSQLVLKLLAKAPEHRYQSARGLHADLVRIAGFVAGRGAQQTFVLGCGDIAPSLQLPHQLYGRESEQRLLAAQLEQVIADGRSRLVTIAGSPGLGKSALIHSVETPLSRSAGALAVGKFEQVEARSVLAGEAPYVGFARALSTLVEQLLTESDERLARWRARLGAALGPLAAVVAELVPTLRLVLGELPEAPRVEHDASRTRLQRALVRFIAVFAREQPLVLVLDDLQWADDGSLAFLRVLLREAATLPLLVIAAYRDELASDHAVRELERELAAAGRAVRIELGPLADPDLQRLLTDVLGRRPGELAEIVARKTERNPLFVRQFLLHLEDLGLLWIGAMGWTWDLSAIASAGIPDDILAFMAAKLERLPAGQRELLALAACVGLRFEPALLACVAAVEADDEQLTAQLYALQSAGLLEPAGRSYQFAHDRIREAARAQLAPSRQRWVHRTVGRALLGQAQIVGERLFEIVDHLDLGIDDAAPMTAQERDALALLNVEAGERALGNGVWSAALRYFGQALRLLPDESEGDDLDFRARYGHAQAISFAGDTAAAAQAFDALLAWQLSPRQLGQVVARRVRLLLIQGRTREALDFGLGQLARYGIAAPREPSLARVLLATARAWRLARRAELDRLLSQPALVGAEAHAILDIIAALELAAFVVDPHLYALLVAHHAHFTLSRGFHPTGPEALAKLAFVAMTLGLGPRAGQLAEVAVTVAQSRATTVEARAGALLIARLVIAPQVTSYRRCVAPLPALYRDMIEIGDRLNAGFVAASALVFHIDAGTHLRDFVALEQQFSRENLDWGSEDGAANARMSLRYAATLADPAGQSPGFVAREHPEIAARGEPVRLTVDIGELSGRVLLGQHARAWTIVRRIGEGYAAALRGHPFAPRFALFSTVLLADLHVGPERVADPPSRRRLRRMIRARVATLRDWARRCPINFAPMLAIAEAERAAVDGDELAAVAHFERARALAEASGVSYLEGFACQRLAEHARRWGRLTTCEGALRAAHTAHARWGASALVTSLERAHPDRFGPAASSSGLNRDPSSVSISAGDSRSIARQSITTSLDVASMLETMQAIGQDLDLDEVVSRVLGAAIENAGADRGALLLERDEVMAVAAIGDETKRVTCLTEPLPLTHPAAGEQLATSAVHYVLRTGAALVVDDLADDPRFADDPYVVATGVRALLCTPIHKQKQRVGVLVLENRLQAGAFTTDRLEVLNLLVGQAAGALDNARLYAALGRSEVRWRSLVDGVPDIITLLDERGQIEFVNHLGRRNHVDAQQLLGKPLEDLLDPRQVAPWRAAIERVLGRGDEGDAGELDDGDDGIAGEGNDAVLELRLRLPGSPEPRWFMTRLAGLEIGGRVGKLLAISTDITERKQLESTLRQQQRLESLGTLASGVAHEINNPIQGILNYAELLDLEAGDSPIVREYAHDIVHEAERVSSIVRNLLTFSRRDQDAAFERAEVCEVIGGATALARAILRKEQIAVLVDIEPGLPEIRCRPPQIQQIIMNLLTNARDAINLVADASPGARRIDIRATRWQRGRVRVSVCDHAGGIPESVREQIFDPFFTTKGHDQGTGLGLAVSHGIAREHGGELRFETETGVGTCFHLTLPVADG